MGRSRGTGFVCFWSVEDADKVVEKSDLVHRETSESTTMVLLALHLEYVLAVLIHVDSGQAQSVQASFDTNSRSLVELGTKPGSIRENIGRRTGGNQERSNATER